MEINGSQYFEAPCTRVYDALNNVKLLQKSIPGCENIEKLAGNGQKITIALNIGPVAMSFSVKFFHTDLNPPNGFTVHFSGGSTRITIVPEGKGSRLTYASSISLGGTLGLLGRPLIEPLGKRLAGEFFARLAELAGTPDVTADPANTARPAWLVKLAGIRRV